jgi:integrase
LHARFSADPRPWSGENDRVVALTSAELTWPCFWDEVASQLRHHNYSRGTRRLYRSVLRGFAHFFGDVPGRATARDLYNYLVDLSHRSASAPYMAQSISVLRTAFDKIADRDLTRRLPTPKRAQRLPELLNADELQALLAAAPTVRDRLLLGLMAGCGLKVGEVCASRWQDVAPDGSWIDVAFARGTRTRRLWVPTDLRTVLGKGRSVCLPEAHVFQGRIDGRALTTRTAERIVKAAARDAHVPKSVTSMVLRHTFAVDALRSGMNVVELMRALGHQCIETTLRYERCLLPEGVESPLDRLRRLEANGLPAADHDPALFPEPLDVSPLELPFEPPEGGGLLARATDFVRLLRTHIGRRFLCARRAQAPP